MKRLHNIPELISRRKNLRNNTTPQEVLLWSRLKNSQTGFKFRRQHSIGGYIADFYCPKNKLAIEIDGSQHFQKDAQEYDKNRTEFFKILGVRVIRFTNTEINTNLDSVIMKIISRIIIHHPLPPPPQGGGE
ncbi:MAG: endonuclease domain-containing protein [bacterium]